MNPGFSFEINGRGVGTGVSNRNPTGQSVRRERKTHVEIARENQDLVRNRPSAPVMCCVAILQ
jgi:hypothetical protein